MDEEKKEEVSEDTEEKTSEPEVTEEKETKEDFVKEEVVPAGKYNQAIRKQRESDLEKRELEKQLAEAKKAKPEKEESEDEDVFKEEEKEKLPDINHLIDEKVKPVLERLSRRENDDRKNQRDTFFTKHPEYLDAKKWNELLDEMDNSLNPNSKDNHYTQLEKAHRILSAEQGYSEIEKKKQELAADSASKGDGSNKPEGKKSGDEREDRLGKRMPIGYEFKQ